MNVVALYHLQSLGWRWLVYSSHCDVGGDLYVCALFQAGRPIPRQFVGRDVNLAIDQALRWAEDDRLKFAPPRAKDSS